MSKSKLPGPRILARLYKLCLSHSYLPSDLVKTVVVPLIKNNTADVSDKSNYRPILRGSVLNLYLRKYVKTVIYHDHKAAAFLQTVVEEHEDLLSPNFNTLESLREARRDGCNMYVIFLANGLQVSRLLKFGDR